MPSKKKAEAPKVEEVKTETPAVEETKTTIPPVAEMKDLKEELKNAKPTEGGLTGYLRARIKAGK